MKRYTEAQMITLLREEISKHGSQAAFAKRVGVSAAYLSDVLLIRRHANDKILGELGLRKDVVYVRD